MAQTKPETRLLFFFSTIIKCNEKVTQWCVVLLGGLFFTACVMWWHSCSLVCVCIRSGCTFSQLTSYTCRHAGKQSRCTSCNCHGCFLHWLDFLCKIITLGGLNDSHHDLWLEKCSLNSEKCVRWLIKNNNGGGKNPIYKQFELVLTAIFSDIVGSKRFSRSHKMY